MGFFSDDSDQAQHNQNLYQSDSEPNQATWTAEAVSGAAAYEAAKAYENKCARDGKPQSHAEAKAILAGLAGLETDRLFQTKGLDWIDQEKAKREAARQAQDAISSDNY